MQVFHFLQVYGEKRGLPALHGTFRRLCRNPYRCILLVRLMQMKQIAKKRRSLGLSRQRLSELTGIPLRRICLAETGDPSLTRDERQKVNEALTQREVILKDVQQGSAAPPKCPAHPISMKQVHIELTNRHGNPRPDTVLRYRCAVEDCRNVAAIKIES